MATLIGLYGEPATGKSISLKNLNEESVFYVDADGKGLNYKGWRERYSKEKNNYLRTSEPEKAIKCLEVVGRNEKYAHIKYFIVDTVNNLMTSEEMRRSQERGYDKWTDLASSIWRLVELPSELRDDLIVILVFHSQVEKTEDGYEHIKIKTNGRKTEKNNIDSRFNILLRSVKMDGQYMLETTAHNSTSRTPLGAFEEEYIPNDIMIVLDVLKDY
ncbi:MAG: AAA family ATPase [Lachnospiraceae bacterium]|nr:AAA family ATPase [Lachnospiraceae bacterium]